MAKLEAVERAKHEPIATIGLGCRFPGGADNPQAFWECLRAGTDAIGEVPPTRWPVEQYYAPQLAPGKMYTRHGGFLPDVASFDTAFFGISAREALSMDPQQRLANRNFERPFSSTRKIL